MRAHDHVLLDEHALSFGEAGFHPVRDLFDELDAAQAWLMDHDASEEV